MVVVRGEKRQSGGEQEGSEQAAVLGAVTRCEVDLMESARAGQGSVISVPECLIGVYQEDKGVVGGVMEPDVVTLTRV